MNTEEIVEMTPAGNAKLLAQQLLAVAADTDNTYRIDDVKTTSSGPKGLAFLVPVGLYDIWNLEVNGISPDVEEPEIEPETEAATETSAPAPKRNRAAKTATSGKE